MEISVFGAKKSGRVSYMNWVCSLAKLMIQEYAYLGYNICHWWNELSTKVRDIVGMWELADNLNIQCVHKNPEGTLWTHYILFASPENMVNNYINIWRRLSSGL
jgi:hypothetical protein